MSRSIVILCLLAAGFSLAAGAGCPVGYFCSPTNGGVAVRCNSGQWCPVNSTFTQPCPAGFYCPDGGVSILCPSGYYCIAGTSSPSKCLWWTLSFCDAGATKPAKGWGALLFLIIFLVFFVGISKLMAYYQDKKRFLFHERLMSLSKSENPVLKAKNPAKFEELRSSNQMLKCLKPKGPNATFDFDFFELGLELPNGKKILSGVTGSIHHGHVCAIMGPSGAGKTTFLSVLTGKVERTSGKVLINNSRHPIQAYKKLVGYVPQEDIMMRDLTVRENISMAADVKLPVELSLLERQRVVDDVIGVLDLVDVQHTVVGDEKTRGISGGQRKRVNIGLELVGDPSVLFLDEPTSGLDSTSAEQVVRSLCHISHQLNLTVATVIHQPSFSVFSLFDEVLLLGKGGRTVYLGPVKDVQQYFENLGFRCPDGHNPADFLMEVIAGKSKRAGKEKYSFSDLFLWWDQELARRTRERELQSSAKVEEKVAESAAAPANAAPLKTKGDLSGRNSPGFWLQTYYFLRRAAVQHFRATAENMVDVILVVIAGVLIGITYGGEQSIYEGPMPASVQAMCSPAFAKKLCMYPQRDISGVFSTASLGVGLTSIMAALRCFGREVVVYWRESSSGVNTLSYFVGKNLEQMTLIVAIPLVFLAGFYSLIQPQADFGAYLYVTIMITFACFGLGYLISVVLDGTLMQLAAVVVVLISSLVCGLNPTMSEMDESGGLGTVLYSVSYARYSVEAYYLIELKQYKSTYDISATLGRLGYTEDTGLGLSILGLFLMGLISRILAYVCLRFMHRDKQK